MPKNQVPPPEDFLTGPFDDAIMAPLPDMQWDDDSDMMQFDNPPKKNKNSGGKNNNKNGDSNYNSYRKPVAVRYEAYLLSRGRPEGLPEGKLGGKSRGAGGRHDLSKISSWSTYKKDSLFLSEEAIMKMASDHQQRTKGNPSSQLLSLSNSQRAAVTRLCEERRSEELDRNATWIYHDIDRKWGKGTLFSPPEVVGLQVILKRTDFDGRKALATTTTTTTTTKTMKNGKDRSNNEQQYYQDDFDDIVEVYDVPNKNKNNSNGKNKGGTKKQKKQDQQRELVDPIFGLGMDLDDIEPLPQNHNNHHHLNQQQFNDYPQVFDQQQDFRNQQMPPPIHPSQMQPPIMQQPFQASPRQPTHDINGNPFTPLPNVHMPVNIDSPFMPGQEWIHPQHNHHQRHHSAGARAHSQERPKSARRVSERQMEKIVDKLGDKFEDKFEELAARLESAQLRDDDSSESQYDGRSGWSRGASPSRSYTPPSEYHSHFSDRRQRPSLERRKSSGARPKYRSKAFQDADIEPAYTHQRIDDRDRDRDRRPPRRQIQRSITYHPGHPDDYPPSRAVEYVPVRAPEAPLRRRLTERGDEYDFQERDRLRDYDRRDRERDYDRRDREREFVPEYRRRDVGYEQHSRYRGGGGYFD
ncbi:uncharacterized protein LTR77_011162 [Saxophila tyrrhenica]|uniref:Uncharacterized protein n=1 Tax=Saxophila tyrrhenica TaxID=1690608 RepID=A0AAV9NUY4_9PEZI|nr:hypothetical protein LTR77_011162 [Saxophila tyrrhenica]